MTTQIRLCIVRNRAGDAQGVTAPGDHLGPDVDRRGLDLRTLHLTRGDQECITRGASWRKTLTSTRSRSSAGTAGSSISQGGQSFLYKGDGLGLFIAQVGGVCRLAREGQGRYAFVMNAAKRLPPDESRTLDPDAPGVIVERARGVVLMSPRPARPHIHAAGQLHTLLNSRFGLPAGPQDPGGWAIHFEPEIEIGEDDLVPDIAGWHADRAPEITGEATFDTPPNWLCEVLSPSTAAYDRTDKMPVYTGWNVRHVWLCDPVLRTLEVYRLDGESYRLITTVKGPQVVRLEPFEAIALNLGLIWPPPVRAR